MYANPKQSAFWKQVCLSGVYAMSTLSISNIGKKGYHHQKLSRTVPPPLQPPICKSSSMQALFHSTTASQFSPSLSLSRFLINLTKHNNNNLNSSTPDPSRQRNSRIIQVNQRNRIRHLRPPPTPSPSPSQSTEPPSPDPPSSNSPFANQPSLRRNEFLPNALPILLGRENQEHETQRPAYHAPHGFICR